MLFTFIIIVIIFQVIERGGVFVALYTVAPVSIETTRSSSDLFGPSKASYYNTPYNTMQCNAIQFTLCKYNPSDRTPQLQQWMRVIVFSFAMLLWCSLETGATAGTGRVGDYSRRPD